MKGICRSARHCKISAFLRMGKEYFGFAMVVGRRESRRGHLALSGCLTLGSRAATVPGPLYTLFFKRDFPAEVVTGAGSGEIRK